jgi:predicted nucleotide-binding protein
MVDLNAPSEALRLPRSLRGAVSEGRLIPFVGAGISCSTRLTPTWSALLHHAAERLCDELEEHAAAGVKAALERNALHEATLLAKEALGPLWTRFLRSQLDPVVPQEAPLELPRAIWTLGSKLVITTNLDTLLERSSAAAVQSWRLVPEPNSSPVDPANLDLNTVWHIQGIIDDPASTILTYDGDALIFENPRVITIWSEAMAALQKLARENTLLFLGSSAPLYWRRSFLDGAEGPHYFLTIDRERQAAERLFEARRLPIKVLSCADFSEQGRILASLAEHATQSPRLQSHPVSAQLGDLVRTAPPAAIAPTLMPSSKGAVMPDSKQVFIIHGRNIAARTALEHFLRVLGLQPVDFDQLAADQGGTAFIGDIVRAGLERAQGIVALFTPDEYAGLRPDHRGAHDKPDESQRWQARPNVIFEAGMAYGMAAQRTVLVTLGTDISLFSDVAGVHVVRLHNAVQSRGKLRQKLIGMGCDVNQRTDAWTDPTTSGDFEACVNQLRGVSPRDPFRD